MGKVRVYITIEPHQYEFITQKRLNFSAILRNAIQELINSDGIEPTVAKMQQKIKFLHEQIEARNKLLEENNIDVFS